MAVKRPPFRTMLYYANQVKTGDLGRVGEIIGGKVKYNIDAGIFKNACALRLSYALNKSGVIITRKNTPGGIELSSGKDGYWYIPRKEDLKKFLIANWEKPDRVFTKAEELNFRQGLIITDNNFLGATGHATLLIAALPIPEVIKNRINDNGKIKDEYQVKNKTIGLCFDSHCYFDDPSSQTKSISFWRLP